MGVRYFCDHCGNTISDRKTMHSAQYGPARYTDDDDDDDELPRKKSTGLVKPIKRVSIELCTNCLPVWMKRVADLTGKSDV